MKTSVREGLFETNSSSTHTLAIYSQSLWRAWAEDKAFYHPEKGICMESDLNSAMKNEYIKTLSPIIEPDLTSFRFLRFKVQWLEREGYLSYDELMASGRSIRTKTMGDSIILSVYIPE